MKTNEKEGSKKGIIKAKSDAASDLTDLFEDGLKDIYFAEKALTKVLPKMIRNASSAALIDAITDHLTENEEQIVRLEKVFIMIGVKPSAKKCDAILGLIEEGESIMESTELGVVRDAGIIMACQKIKHYEIASYGTLRQFAETLGLFNAVDILEEILDEEKSADRLLTKVAVNTVNVEAFEED